MIKRKKTAVTGIVLAGVAFVAWQKSKKQREKFYDWKKQQIENIYFASLNERDIGWG